MNALIFICCYPEQIQLSEREEVAEKYQSMLQDARRELQREAATHRQEMAALRSKLHSQDDRNLAKLKTEALEAASSPSPSLPSDQQLERLLVLEELTASQGEELKKLHRQMETEEEESRGKMQEYECIVKNLQDELREKGRLHRKQMEGSP